MCAMALAEKRVQDRRIQKTQRLLHEALFSLIHEKSYNAIVVKEILDRANVGRSTFYTHFRNKDELLVSGIHDLLRSVQSAGRPPSATRYERMLWFSLPIFEHISHYRRAREARIGTRGRAIMHEHLQHVLADLMAEDVRKEFQRRREKVGQVPPELFVQYVASTFILVLHWWVDRGSPLSPKEVNDVFRALVLPTMAVALE
jgi:AcrR family transcriptional regulator